MINLFSPFIPLFFTALTFILIVGSIKKILNI